MKFCAHCNTCYGNEVNFCPTCGQSLSDQAMLVAPPIVAPVAANKGFQAWYLLVIPLLLVPLLFLQFPKAGAPPTPEPSVSSYFKQVGGASDELRDANYEMEDLCSRVEKDKDLLQNPKWLAEVDVTAVDCSDAADTAYAIAIVPDSCKHIQQLLLKLADETRLAGADFKKAVHENSVPAMDNALDHAQNEFTLTKQLANETRALANKIRVQH